MQDAHPAITPRHDLSPLALDELEDRLYAYNAERSGFHDAAPIAFTAELDGDLIGAVAGFTWAGFCELRQVWVHPDHRGGGLGATLMGEAFQEARRRGCAQVFLATYDFQAPRFYARLGFRAAAVIRDKPVGHAEFLMRLDLEPSAGPQDLTGRPVTLCGPAS